MSKEEVLYKLLHKEFGYYERLLELIENETGQLERERPLHEILQGIKKRQIIMSCIEDIEKAIAPLKRFWNDKSSKEDYESCRVKTMLQDLDEIVKKILDIDQKNQSMLQKRMFMLSKEGL